MEAWENGQFKPWEEVTLPVLSFSVARGVVVFEVAGVVPTDDGPAVLCLEQHVKRMYNSARTIHMDLPWTPEEMTEAVLETCRRSQVTSGLVKWLAYYPGMEILPIPKDKSVSMAIFAMNFDYLGLDGTKPFPPVNIGTAGFLKHHPQAVPLQAKVCGNYVNAYLSKVDVLSRGFDDAVQIGCDGFVAEGVTNNIFFVREDTVLTPKLENILEGTTRGLVINVIRDMGLKVFETDIYPEEIYGFDEAFYASSVTKLQPILSIDGRPLGEGAIGPVTAKIWDRLSDVLAGRVPQFASYLTRL